MKECCVLIYGIDGLVDDIEVFFSLKMQKRMKNIRE